MKGNWTRRDALLSAAGLTGLLLNTEWLDSAHAQATDYESHPLHRLADTLADIVIPHTDTPGASAAKVAGFVLFALERGMSGLSLRLLEAVQTALNAMAGADFLELPASRRERILSDLDRKAYEAEVIDDNSPDAAWRRIKGVIVAGYYTSEIGATKELINEPVPGQFANIRLTADFRSRSNDVQGGTL